MLNNIVRFWSILWWKALRHWKWRRRSDTFKKTMIQNIPTNRPRSGLKTMILKLYPSQPIS